MGGNILSAAVAQVVEFATNARTSRPLGIAFAAMHAERLAVNGDWASPRKVIAASKGAATTGDFAFVLDAIYEASGRQGKNSSTDILRALDLLGSQTAAAVVAFAIILGMRSDGADDEADDLMREILGAAGPHMAAARGGGMMAAPSKNLLLRAVVARVVFGAMEMGEGASGRTLALAWAAHVADTHAAEWRRDGVNAYAVTEAAAAVDPAGRDYHVDYQRVIDAAKYSPTLFAPAVPLSATFMLALRSADMPDHAAAVVMLALMASARFHGGPEIAAEMAGEAHEAAFALTRAVAAEVA